MMRVKRCIEHVWSTQSPPWHIQTVSLGIFPCILMSAWIDIQTCWTRNYTVKGLVEAALTIGRTFDCMSVVFLYVRVLCTRTHTHRRVSISRRGWCCCRLPESGTPLLIRKTLKRDAHTGTHTPVEITRERATD